MRGIGQEMTTKYGTYRVVQVIDGWGRVVLAVVGPDHLFTVFLPSTALVPERVLASVAMWPHLFAWSDGYEALPVGRSN